MLKNLIFLGVFLGIVSVFFLSSCAARKDLVYLQQDSVEIETHFKEVSTKLASGDILTISVTADDIRATEPFNQVSVYQAGTIQPGNPFLPTYTIDNDGYIEFPKIGKIKLAGLSRIDAIKFLQEKINPFILNPGINITLRNFRVSVLGEVVKPGTFTVENDRISILEALSMAGDLTINGVRKNILIVREEEGMKKEYRVDLTNRNIYNSPAYFLKQNDVVYVEPNGAKIQSSKYTQNTSIFVSIAGLIITIVAVILK